MGDMVNKAISIKNDTEALDWLAKIGAISLEEAFLEKARKLPVEDSLGGVNRFYMHCEPTDSGMSYGVCRHIIQAFKENRLAGFSECVPYLESGACPAMKMLAQETEAGHAIFYIKGRTQAQRDAERDAEIEARKAIRDKFTGDWQGRFEEKRLAREAEYEAAKTLERSLGPAKEEAAEFLGASGYAEAINAALAETAAPPAERVVARGSRKAPRPAIISRGAKIAVTHQPEEPVEAAAAPVSNPSGRISLAEIARNKLKEKK